MGQSRGEPVFKVLFVCTGNTCRSPLELFEHTLDALLQEGPGTFVFSCSATDWIIHISAVARVRGIEKVRSESQRRIGAEVHDSQEV